MSKIYVVGIGPGNRENMTLRAIAAIEESNVVAGYETYIGLAADLCAGKEIISSKMKQERLRCTQAVQKAKEGNTVSVISSGDSGVYGMAGLLLETARMMEFEGAIEVVPGIPSSSMCASLLGAPLMHDYVSISLSDLMTPWGLIEKRLHMAAEGDFVICLYNPKSRSRREYIGLAGEIIQQYREKNTPVGVVKKAGREGESVLLCTLDSLAQQDIDMFTTVIIGNSQTYVSCGRMITPRGYGKE